MRTLAWLVQGVAQVEDLVFGGNEPFKALAEIGGILAVENDFQSMGLQKFLSCGERLECMNCARLCQTHCVGLQPARQLGDNQDFLFFMRPMAMTQLKKVILFTDTDGRARFRDDWVPLTEGTPQSQLSAWMSSSGCQLRQSPVGFRSTFHCTGQPQWLFVLGGQMEIFLQDGSSRFFGPGEFFYSADTLPEGAAFDATVHGHWSRQVGPDPLVTLFVRD